MADGVLFSSGVLSTDNTVSGSDRREVLCSNVTRQDLVLVIHVARVNLNNVLDMREKSGSGSLLSIHVFYGRIYQLDDSNDVGLSVFIGCVLSWFVKTWC